MESNSLQETEKGSVYIITDTYTPTGKRLGRGCWGIVDEYENIDTGEHWAIKRFDPNEIAKQQMQHRKLTPEKVMRRESIPLGAAKHHLLPRIIERDKKGEMFIGMPVITGGTLQDILNRGQADDKKYAIKMACQISDALGYLHTLEQDYETRDRYHGDLKPQNIQMKLR